MKKTRVPKTGDICHIKVHPFPAVFHLWGMVSQSFIWGGGFTKQQQAVFLFGDDFARGLFWRWFHKTLPGNTLFQRVVSIPPQISHKIPQRESTVGVDLQRPLENLLFW